MEVEMARTNQGVFKQLRNKHEKLKSEFDRIVEEYFIDDEWNPNYDFFSDFGYEADSFCCEAISLENEIQGMLNATKFEDDTIEEEYQSILEKTSFLKRDMKGKFDEVLGLIARSSGYLNDIELRTIDNYKCIRSI